MGVAALSAAVVALWLVATVFGTIALAVGAATGRRGLARWLGVLAAAVAYLLSSLAEVVRWLEPVLLVSPGTMPSASTLEAASSRCTCSSWLPSSSSLPQEPWWRSSDATSGRDGSLAQDRGLPGAVRSSGMGEVVSGQSQASRRRRTIMEGHGTPAGFEERPAPSY